MIEIKVTDYGMNAEGVGKLDGKVILLDKVLIDEVVEANITEDKGNYSIAKTNKIITKSNCRTSAPCPYFQTCGGCDLQHMVYAEQLKFKQQLVQKTIKKICNIDITVNETIPCDVQYGYRNKLSINADKLKFGFFRSNSKDLVEVNHCMLATDNINKIYSLCKDFIINNNLQPLIY